MKFFCLVFISSLLLNAQVYSPMAMDVEFTVQSAGQPIFIPNTIITFSGGGVGQVITARASGSSTGSMILINYSGSISGTFVASNAPSNLCTVVATMIYPTATGYNATGAFNGSSYYIQGAPFSYNYSSPGTRGRNTFTGIGAGNFTMGGGVLGGSLNSGFGSLTQHNNVSGTSNSSFGVNALYGNQSGSNNSSFGADNLENLITGSANSTFGRSVGGSLIDGSNNVVFSNRNETLIHGSGNTVLGSCLVSDLDNTTSICDGVGNLRAFFNSSGLPTFSGLVSTPASSSSNCTLGTFSFDSSFFYACVATNTWRRTAIATW